MRHNHTETTDFATFQQKLGKYNNITCHKLDMLYKQTDPRTWTAIINQGTDNVVVHYFINRYDLGERSFDVLTSSRNFFNIEQDDIYQTLDMIINKNSQPSESPFAQL